MATHYIWVYANIYNVSRGQAKPSQRVHKMNTCYLRERQVRCGRPALARVVRIQNRVSLLSLRCRPHQRSSCKPNMRGVQSGTGRDPYQYRCMGSWRRHHVPCSWACVGTCAGVCSTISGANLWLSQYPCY